MDREFQAPLVHRPADDGGEFKPVPCCTFYHTKNTYAFTCTLTHTRNGREDQWLHGWGFGQLQNRKNENPDTYASAVTSIRNGHGDQWLFGWGSGQLHNGKTEHANQANDIIGSVKACGLTAVEWCHKDPNNHGNRTYTGLFATQIKPWFTDRDLEWHIVNAIGYKV